MKQMIALILLSCLGLGACGHSGAHYRPIVDGPRSPAYEADLKACQALARERGYFNDDVKSEALLGAGIGTVVGAFSDGFEGAAVGAALGGAAGAGERAWWTRYERSTIVCECMRGRGHKVVEY